MWDHIGSLLDYHGRDVPPEVRVLKLTEETGEAAQALIGMQGWNPRKGISATRDDLLDELADVMLTAAVAMAGITQDARQAGEIFQRRLATVLARAGLDNPASSLRHWTASAIVLHPTEDKVLLVDHVKSGLLLYPGGHVEPGETLAEAAIREVREETGIDAAIISGPVPCYSPVVSHPVPFAVIEARAADPVNGDHQHIDGLYLYELFRLSIRPLLRRDSLGHGRAVAGHTTPPG
jgi:8-oxo-dGTP pyrophosphatase MutT (NUDIX family)/NTP pyrophosphatase (non-canonical NTP hydrolase)